MTWFKISVQFGVPLCNMQKVQNLPQNGHKWPIWSLRSICGIQKWSQWICHAQNLWGRHQKQVSTMVRTLLMKSWAPPLMLLSGPGPDRLNYFCSPKRNTPSYSAWETTILIKVTSLLSVWIHQNVFYNCLPIYAPILVLSEPDCACKKN